MVKYSQIHPTVGTVMSYHALPAALVTGADRGFGCIARRLLQAG